MQPLSPYRQSADAVARTCCFVAVLSLPLYFSLLTTTGYEPDKAVLVRVLAVLAAAAWLAGEIAQPMKLRLRSLPPLLWASFGLFIAMVIATILSIDPRLSFWGSAARQEGLVTWAAYLVFLVVAATRLRSSRDWRRLISALLLGSVAVAAYGLLQQLGIDPVPAAGDPETLQWPVRSTLGQHVFLGSYLVMVIPFALARFLEGPARNDHAEADGDGWQSVMTAAAAIIAMVAVFFAVMLLGVAHPSVFAVLPGVLAAYAGLVILLDRIPPSRRFATAGHWAYGALTLALCLTLAVTGARGAWLGGLATLPVFSFLVARRQGRAGISRIILGVSGVALLMLVLLNIPEGPLQPLRTVRGLNRVANITDSGGAGGSAQGRLLLWQGVGKLMTSTPADGQSWGGPARDLVGYGPESLHWAFQTVFPLKLRVVTSEIWTWDRSHDIYLDVLVDAGLLGLLAFFAMLVLFFTRLLRLLALPGENRGWILIPMGAAVAGHLVDGIFGLETPVTLLPLFLFVGLVSQSATETEAEPIGEPVPAATPLRQYGILWLALAVAAVLLAFIPTAPSVTVLVTVWVLSLVAAVRSVTVLLGVAFPAKVMVQGSRAVVALAVIVLLTLGAFLTQLRYEGAAVAERSGLSALGQNSVPVAIGDLQYSVNEDAFEPQYRTELAGAYLTLGANHLDSAHPTYIPSPADITSLDPAVATGLSRDQLFTLAAYTLRSAINLSPLDPDAYGNLGNLYLEWNRPHQAAGYFRQAEALSYKNPRYIDQEALAELQTGNVKAARAGAARAFGLDDTFWYTYYTMALVDHRLGDHPGSRQAASLALVWVKNYWPSPPQGQIQQLHLLTKVG
jgi:O-antigen ligase/tetratricopeptide (TPR) repeat protein